MNQKQIKSGRYKSYDGVVIIVLDEVENTETGEKLILYCLDNGGQKLRVMPLNTFIGKIEVDGKLVDRYKMGLNLSKRSLKKELHLFEDYRDKKEDSHRHYYVPKSHLQYAKVILENYADDSRRYRLSVERKQLVGLLKEEYIKIRDDHRFLKECLNTVLSEYKDIMLECFINKKSIRQYAEEKGLNRGSVEYKRKKFIYEFAMLLEQRDLANKKKD